MTFTWPLALLFVLVIPLVLGVYLLTMRRRRKQAVSYSSVALLRSAGSWSIERIATPMSTLT